MIMKLLVTGGLGFIGSNFISRIFENHLFYPLTQYHSDCAFTFNAAIPYTKAITESGG